MSGGIILKNLPDGHSLMINILGPTLANQVTSPWILLDISTKEYFSIMAHVHSAGAAIELEMDIQIVPHGEDPNATTPSIWGLHMNVGTLGNTTPINIPFHIPTGFDVWYHHRNGTSNAAVNFGGGVTLLN